MPKHEITFEADKVPAELASLVKDGKLTFWVGENGEDLKLAAELNPTLEANRDTILREKRTLEADYNALKKTVGDETLDKAKIVLENEQLKTKVKTDDEVKLLDSFKTVFPNLQPSEVTTKLPALVEASAKVETYEKRDKQEALFGASGYKDKTVFMDLINNPEKMKGVVGDLFVETVEGTDKKAIFANVQTANGTTEKKNFSEWTQSNEAWKPYLPALGIAAPDNQYWNQQNPPTENNALVPEWKKRMDAQNAEAQKAGSVFAPPSQVNNQGTTT